MREAHSLHPTVMVGKQGVTESVTAAVQDQLYHHELVKIKFLEFKDEKQELVNELARRTDSERVAVIGNIGILYRRNEDPQKRIYRGIPEA